MKKSPGFSQFAAGSPVARVSGICQRYGKTLALDGMDLELPAGCMVGLIGPDGVGKSTLLALLSGARRIQRGKINVLGGDMAGRRHRARICPLIAYMPQGLGKNLYPALSVEENLQFFARLFGHGQKERRRRIDMLTTATGLHPFLDRPAGKLSGGMKQKLGLCCALIHDPELLILDEPTTGVDPLSRSQFWELIRTLRENRPAMSVIAATAYMEEADRFDWLVAMDAGKILAVGPPSEICRQTGTGSLEAAFISLLPESRRRGHQKIEIPPLRHDDSMETAIEARDLTMRFGDFVAVDHVSFAIRQGEIFGFLGSNGCGKTTTMKMLTGLLSASEGEARLFGRKVNPGDIMGRQRVGYMSQSFSLYPELNVQQNLVLHARLFNVEEAEIPKRVDEMVARFGLEGVRHSLPRSLPLGIRQRLSLAVAMIHRPELLILDEPTSGVDPIARDHFWRLMIDLARKDRVTIFISTHFMNEAERCDRISLMHAGKVLVSDTPSRLKEARQAKTLEQAFIAYLKDAAGRDRADVSLNTPTSAIPQTPKAGRKSPDGNRPGFQLQRMMAYARLEAKQLRRDPVRGVLALLGTAILMFIMGYGLGLDVEDLRFAVLDHDRTSLSRDYALNLSGSRYFIEAPPLSSYAELDQRMVSGEISLAIEIPPGFARDVYRSGQASIGAWVDGAMPFRGETIKGYLQGMHQGWLMDQIRHGIGARPVYMATLETRFRYNPDVKSLPAMVPAVIPLLLLMIPAMLTALAVVREKELGSIVNFYVTPVSRVEFLLGKQLPYVVLGMLNFFLMVFLAVTVFGVAVTGSFMTLTFAAFLFVLFSTGAGLFASTFTRSQIAAMFLTMVGTMLPAIQFAGMINPVSSLEGGAALIGRIYPASHFLAISRGVFSKALSFGDLSASFFPLFLSAPFILWVAIFLLKKQER